MEENKNIDATDLVKYVPSQFRDMASSLIKINNDGIFVETSCPICLSKFRTEAEAIFLGVPQYDHEKKYKVTKDFLDSKGEKFAIDIIKNHCNSHLNQAENQLRKSEYINTISNICSTKTNTIDEVDLVIACLKERLVETAKLVPGAKGSLIEVETTKSNIVSQISKSFATLLKLRAEILGELKENGEVVVIQRGRFKQAINNALSKAKTEDEKKLIIDLLKDISKAEDKSSS